MNQINSHNTAIIIISYNPDSNLFTLLKRSKEIVDKVIVVDNGSENIGYIKHITSQLKVELLEIRYNSGIGKAINIGVNILNNKIYKWFITFDQDSLPNKNIIKYYNKITKKENNIGLIGSDYYEDNKELENYKKFEYIPSNIIITSGSLHNIEAYYEVGTYNEKMFIDCVDFEFVTRLNKFKFNTFFIKNKLIKHQVGQIITKKFFGKVIRINSHNEFREYYIIRNNIFLIRKYLFKNFYLANKRFNKLISHLLYLLFVENNRYKKIRRGLLGLIHGIIKKNIIN